MKAKTVAKKVEKLVRDMNLRADMQRPGKAAHAVPGGSPGMDLRGMLTNGDPPSVMLWGSEE